MSETSEENAKHRKIRVASKKNEGGKGQENYGGPFTDSGNLGSGVRNKKASYIDSSSLSLLIGGGRRRSYKAKKWNRVVGVGDGDLVSEEGRKTF